MSHGPVPVPARKHFTIETTANRFLCRCWGRPFKAWVRSSRGKGTRDGKLYVTLYAERFAWSSQSLHVSWLCFQSGYAASVRTCWLVFESKWMLWRDKVHVGGAKKIGNRLFVLRPLRWSFFCRSRQLLVSWYEELSSGLNPWTLRGYF